MSEIVRLLHVDHLNSSRLLLLLEEQVAALPAGVADLGLCAAVMRYMTEFPDIVHHPKEDLLFARLRRRDAAAHAMLQQLESEHRWLARHGKSLFEALRGESAAHDALAAGLTEYLSIHRAHMDVEESKIFPLARALLTPEDWRALAPNVSVARVDPLFGGRAEASYRALRETLQARAAAHKR